MLNIVKITDYMSKDLIALDLKSRNKEAVLEELSVLMSKSENIQDKNIIKKSSYGKRRTWKYRNRKRNSYSTC